MIYDAAVTLSRHDRLERCTWDLFWLPPVASAVDRPELMVVSAPRPLPYLNCVYRTRAAGERIAALIDEVAGLHRDFGSRWTVADTVDNTELEARLDAAGYRIAHVHDARVTAVDAFVPRPDCGAEIRRVTDEQTLRDCWRVNEIAFGQAGDYREEDLAFELADCAPEGARTQRYVAYVDGEPVSSGGMNIYPELSFTFLWGGGTVAAARGRGVYSAILAARVARAAELGIEHAGLYARVESSSPIVGNQGFANCGRMSYWERD